MTLVDTIFSPRKPGLAGLLAAAYLVSSPGCNREPPDTKPGGAAPAAAGLHRVVSLSSPATRFVLAIGAGAQLVGADAASVRMPELSGLRVVDLESAPELSPDLVLVPEEPSPGSPAAAALAHRGAKIAAFAPHSFEDALVLVRDIGRDLVGEAQTSRFEAAFSRPLAKIGGESHGQPRPRVVAVVSFEPLVIAGGHSFETDLIEIAGGQSVTHPGNEPRLPIDADRWSALSPDLVLVIGPRPASPRAEQALRNALPPGPDVAFFPFDPLFWLAASDEPARRLRAVIEPIAARMALEAKR